MHFEITALRFMPNRVCNRKYPVDQRSRRPCPDCLFCQECSQDRCRLCRAPQKAAQKKLSIAEQIALYERINKKKTKPSCPARGVCLHKAGLDTTIRSASLISKGGILPVVRKPGHENKAGRTVNQEPYFRTKRKN
jgi:hypothetical protein